MSESSWLFKSSWASTYFRRTSDGQVFTCISPWGFGQLREYRMSDGQAEQLVARISRANVVAMIASIPLTLAFCLTLAFVAPDPSSVSFWLAIGAFTVLLIAASAALVYRAGAAALAG